MSHGPTVADYFPPDKATHLPPHWQAVLRPEPRRPRVMPVDDFGDDWFITPHVHALPKGDK